jgi:hypothetical protein
MKPTVTVTIHVSAKPERCLWVIIALLLLLLRQW